jgi:glutamate--cysteine ligase
VGLEGEWHTRPHADPAADVLLDDLRSWAPQATALPGGCAVTWEPGAQLELSSPPACGVQAAIDRLAADAEVTREALGARGVELVGVGLDPIRGPRRQLRAPRYDAMEAFFDGDGPEGRLMMTRTAALQVNLDGGADELEAERRWRRAHLLGPTLVAMFANSPWLAGRPTGWCSTRQATWHAMDPTRTSSALGPRGRDAWVDYALAARVMFIRLDDRRFVPLQGHLSFGSWLARGHELGWPTGDDLDYHLTTLFPPVRPRPWLEVRYLDALPDPWWRVAAAVTTALIDDEDAAAEAEEAVRPTASLWCEGARLGLRHPDLATSAARCFAAATAALGRLGVDTATSEQCAAFADRYVAQARCPADDWADGAAQPADAAEGERWPS